MKPTRIVPDVTAMKALAHPLRMRMLGMLRMDGPATATQLAQRLDLNTGATSYHLRQLEQHGFITEDTERGSGRDRWWRAAHDYTVVDAGRTPAERDAADAFAQSATSTLSQWQQRAVMERAELPDAWRHLSVSTDHFLALTLAQATELRDRVFALLEEYATAYPAHPVDPDPDARPYMVQYFGFPRPGQLADPQSDAQAEPPTDPETETETQAEGPP